MARLSSVAFLLGLLSAGSSAQQAWIVNPNGTGHFSDLSAAIAFAAAGDTLLMQGGGNYLGNYTIDKSLSLVHESGYVTIEQLTVETVTGSAYVTVTGVKINMAFIFGPASFEGVGEFCVGCAQRALVSLIAVS